LALLSKEVKASAWILGGVLIGQRFTPFSPWKNPERNIFGRTPSENVYRQEKGDGGDHIYC